MRALIDTNVLLDVLAKRAPYFGAAQRVWSLAEAGELAGFVSAISLNNCYYIVRKYGGRAAAEQAARLIRRIFAPIDLTTRILDEAISADFPDLEDAIQYYSAVQAGADVILTRDVRAFRKGDLTVLTPVELLAKLSAGSP